MPQCYKCHNSLKCDNGYNSVIMDMMYIMFSFVIICHNGYPNVISVIMVWNVIMDYNGYNGVIIHISVIIYSKCYNGYNSHVIRVIMDILRPLL